MKHKKHRYSGVRPTEIKDKWRIEWVDYQFRRRTKIFYGTENDAMQFRRSLIVKRDRIQNGLEPPPRKYLPRTLADLFENFLKNSKVRVRSGSMDKKTLERYECVIKAFSRCKPMVLNTQIMQLTPNVFEEYIISRIESGHSKNGINTDLRHLRAIFNYATRNHFLQDSPLKLVKMVSAQKKPVRYLDEAEMVSLNESLNSLDLKDDYEKDAYDVLNFLLYTGARSSEVLFPRLTWDCISEDKILFPLTKGKSSRSIPMTDKLREILSGRAHIKGGPFHLTPDLIHNRVLYVFRKAGIEKASPHTLRKTAGAYHYIANRDIFATSRFLGHTKVTTTQSYYIGLIQSLQTENSIKFDTVVTNTMLGVRISYV